MLQCSLGRTLKHKDDLFHLFTFHTFLYFLGCLSQVDLLDILLVPGLELVLEADCLHSNTLLALQRPLLL